MKNYLDGEIKLTQIHVILLFLFTVCLGYYLEYKVKSLEKQQVEFSKQIEDIQGGN